MGVTGRGEAELVLVDGSSHRLLFTCRGLAEVESVLGVTVGRIIKQCLTRDFSMCQIGELVRVGIIGARIAEGDRSKFTTNDAYDLIEQAGMLDVIEQVTKALLYVTTFRASKAGEDDAPQQEGDESAITDSANPQKPGTGMPL